MAIRPRTLSTWARRVEPPTGHLSHTEGSTMRDADVCAYRPARLKSPLRPYFVEHLHVPPCTAGSSQRDRHVLDALDAVAEAVGLENIERERATPGRTDA